MDASSAVVTVQRLDETSRSQWDNFVRSCPDATFFHLAGWKYVIESVFGHRCYFLYTQRAGAICGVLPLVHIKSILFGNSLVSTGFTVGGGPVVSDSDALPVLEGAAIALADELDVDFLEFRNGAQTHADWANNADLYVHFAKPIGPDPEKDMLAIPRKQRAMVRKGIKAGLMSVIDDDVDRLHPVYAESVRNLGTPVFAKAYFRALQEAFSPDLDIVTVLHDGKAVASVMNFYFRDRVLPYFGGGVLAARNVAGNDFMYWEVMRRAIERGYRVFDFGRSKKGTGAYSFKKNWGFDPQPLTYEFKLRKLQAAPEINPLNPKYRLFIAAWKKLPLPVAGFVGPYSLCWLMGFIASVSMVQQFALVMVIQGIFIAVLGLRIGKLLLFPLAYMFFAVPFGRFLIAPLQDVTAYFVVKGLRLIDIPVFLDGIFISIPTGNFEVAEACSGVRFLIATVALGTLFAHITYQSRPRQISFIFLSIVVPIVANGFRAFGIVLIAYLSNNELAVGVDHIIYGWVFFAIITVILLLVGMTFRDSDPIDPVVDLDGIRKAITTAIDQKKVFSVAAMAVAASVLAPAYAGHMEGRVIPVIKGAFPAPSVGGGWQLAVDRASDWAAVYPNAHAKIQRRYVKGQAHVDLYIAYYTSQREGAELVSSANDVSNQNIWPRASSTSETVRIDGADSSVHRVRMINHLSGKRVAYQWYWIGGRFTANPYVAKILQVGLSRPRR